MRAAYYQGSSAIHVGACVPVPPAAGQVQIRVSHCGLCGTDLHIFHGHMDNRVKPPQVIGHEMSGVIERVGDGVEDWKPGDRVTVRPLDPCGRCAACRRGYRHVCMNLKFIGIDVPGALQALWTVPAHTLHRLPESLSLRDAALIEPIAVACHDIRLAELEAGESAVVLGGGPIGTLVALAARAAQARVLVSEVNPFRIELLRGLGLEVVNPLETDLTAAVNERTGGAGADGVFEVSGTAAAVAQMTDLVRVRGRMVVVAVFPKPVEINLFRFFWRELKLCGARVYEPEDFERAIALAAARAIPYDRLITDVCPLDRLKESFAAMAEGGKVMKILVDCAS